MAERILKCKRCGEKKPVSKMRYYKDVNNLMCIDCINRIKKSGIATKNKQNKDKQEDNKEDKKTRYKCKRCKHIFQLKRNFNKQCPYCGGYELIKQEWNSDLDSLIKDASNPEYGS